MPASFSHRLRLLSLLLGLGLATPVSAQVQVPAHPAPALALTEPPQVIWQGREARILTLEQGKIRETIRKGPFSLALPELCPKPLRLDPTPPPDPTEEYSDPGRIAAISDIHGDFERLKALLKAQGIIAPNLAWSFGAGFLMVVGDVHDRGPQVTECLWFLKGLEAQARKAGGRVIPLLGNHELMVMKGDWRYVHPRYRQMPEGYPDPAQLLGPDSELGRWVRNWPLMVKVGPFLFTHGGVSAGFLDQGLDLPKANAAVRAFLTEGRRSPQADFLFGNRGPLWYRGLIPGATAFTVGDAQVEALLKAFGVRALVVGHTTLPRVSPLQGNRVFAIDAGINEGRPGELWIWEKGQLWRGRADGGREPLSEGSR